MKKCSQCGTDNMDERGTCWKCRASLALVDSTTSSHPSDIAVGLAREGTRSSTSDRLKSGLPAAQFEPVIDRLLQFDSVLKEAYLVSGGNMTIFAYGLDKVLQGGGVSLGFISLSMDQFIRILDEIQGVVFLSGDQRVGLLRIWSDGKDPLSR